MQEARHWKHELCREGKRHHRRRPAVTIQSSLAHFATLTRHVLASFSVFLCEHATQLACQDALGTHHLPRQFAFVLQS